MKRTWLFLLGFLLLAAPAVQAQQVHFAYTNNGDGTITVTEAYYTVYFRHAGPPFTIPSSINGLPVTSIGEDFSDPWGLYFTSITIPASVTNIGDYAFEDDEYLTSIYFEGNAPTVGQYAFETHSGGNTTVYYLAGTSGWSNFGSGIVLWTPQTGSLQVTISPDGATTAGAQWQVDGGTTNDSGVTLTNLIVGDHIVTVAPVPGWYTPDSQAVTIKNGATTKASVVYKALPPNSAMLTVQVNGDGTVSPNENGKALQLGKTYKLMADPVSGWIFSNWVASGSENFVSNNSVLEFIMQTNLFLQANFVPTPFATVAGKYIGLFMPNDSNTVQNSGYVSLTVTTKGTFSGYLQTGATRHTLVGQFDLNGDFTNSVNIPDEGSLTIGLNVELPGDSVITGTISNGNWVAYLAVNQLVSGRVAFTETGRYSVVIAGSDGSTPGLPEGNGYATMNFTKSGPTTLAGTLADGTKFSASSTFCPSGVDTDADWPFYASLYGGRGCFLGWMDLGSSSVTGYFTWIMPAGARAAYPDGFVFQTTASGTPYSESDLGQDRK